MGGRRPRAHGTPADGADFLIGTPMDPLGHASVMESV
jgi:hypothetical protein